MTPLSHCRALCVGSCNSFRFLSLTASSFVLLSASFALATASFLFVYLPPLLLSLLPSLLPPLLLLLLLHSLLLPSLLPHLLLPHTAVPAALLEVVAHTAVPAALLLPHTAVPSVAEAEQHQPALSLTEAEQHLSTAAADVPGPAADLQWQRLGENDQQEAGQDEKLEQRLSQRPP